MTVPFHKCVRDQMYDWTRSDIFGLHPVGLRIVHEKIDAGPVGSDTISIVVEER